MTLRDSFIAMEAKNMNQANVQEQALSAFILVLTGSSLLLFYPGSKANRSDSFLNKMLLCYFTWKQSLTDFGQL